MGALKKHLANIGYPENFGEARRDDFDMVMQSKNDPALYTWYKVFKHLNQLNPFPVSREKWKLWIRINCLARKKITHW